MLCSVLYKDGWRPVEPEEVPGRSVPIWKRPGDLRMQTKTLWVGAAAFGTLGGESVFERLLAAASAAEAAAMEKAEAAEAAVQVQMAEAAE
eukprot:scaffold98432_cov48-Phaeocystis_antarctica.AAC.1